MDGIVSDLRQTLRSLSKNPGFSVAAVLMIALGIGLNTSVFSLVHATLLSPLPYPHADRLTFIWKDFLDIDYPRAPLSPPEVAELRAAAPLHESIGAIWATSGTLVEDGRAQPLRLATVTSNFLSLLGVPPVRGRWFTTADEQTGAPPALVISDGLWQTRFGGSDIIGRRVRIDGGWGMDSGQYTIVGVMPPGFQMLLPVDASVPKSVDAWIPIQYDLATAPRGTAYLRVVGRVAEQARLGDAQQQLELAGREIARRYGRPRRFYAEPLHQDVVRESERALVTLQAAVGFVLLIACANVATLLMMRSHRRRREIRVRTALGATRGDLTRLLLTESLLLAVTGGVVGIGLAYVGLRLLPVLDAGLLPRADAATLSVPVLVFCAVATLGSGLLFGLAPLIESWRVDVTGVLKSASVTSTSSMMRGRSVLVLAEVGLSVMLLIGAGLLIRTFLNLQAVNPGYHSEHVLTFQVSLPPERYDEARLARFTRSVEKALRTLPGVQAAGAVNQLPLDDAPNYSAPYFVAGADDQRGAPDADVRLTTPGYFEAIQASLVAGRWFTEQDDETRPLALIVDERLARRAWPQENPLDQQLGVRIYGGNRFQLRWGRVVGVVRHLRHHRLSEEVREQVYVPFAQAPRNQMAVVARSTVDTDGLMRAVTEQLHTIDPALAPGRVQLLDGYVARSRAPARFSMVLATLFGGLSMLLACLGLYAVISYSVAQRTSELGVRAALGASRSDLLILVLRQGLLLAVIGVLLGLMGSVATTRWMKSLLFGVTTFDVMTFVGVPLVLCATALLACYVPARRAAVVNAAEALRID